MADQAQTRSSNAAARPAPGPRRTLLLTGASRGIGHATVIRFSSAGWRVITCSRHPFPEECPWGAGPEDHIQVDLADLADTERAIEEIRSRLDGGELHALVNNAAISPKAEGGTRLSSIATDIEDPKARLEAIIAQSSKSKEMSHPLRALMPQVSNVSMLGAPILVQIMALLYSRSNLSDVLPPATNITVSNVPGPRQTLYAAGAELLHIFPVSIAVHGVALNITVQSYRDQLDFGFIAGANVIPHVQVLADMLPEELAALQAAYASPPDAQSVAS